MRSWVEAAFSGLAMAVCLAALAVVIRQCWPRLRRYDTAVGVLVLVLPAAVFVHRPAAVAALLVAASVVVVLRMSVLCLHLPGTVLVVLTACIAVDTAVWLPCFALASGTHPLTGAVVVIFTVVLVLVSPTLLVGQFLMAEVLVRDEWTRPARAYAAPVRSGPKVSVHLPCYAEPPDIVIATLNSLARLDYDNFEVVVVDNNTTDPALWQPVAAHCARLGNRFRFHHVEGITGAKAGALNYALSVTGPDAELIALVDADWIVRPDFLERIVGHFTDPRLAAVQTQWDYRDWRGSRFQTGCFWEYRVGFPTLLRGYNERGAALTMGTMCVLRRRAVEQVGRWAPWCLTEDSEIVLRLHAAGYSSMLCLDMFGQGLIPQRFVDYAKQRYRWVFGPVQELQRHWRLVLGPSKLSAAQRFMHLHHGLSQIASAFAWILMLPLTAFGLLSMVWYRQQLPITPTVGMVAALGLVVMPCLRFAALRVAAGTSLRESVVSTLAGMSLQYTCLIAALTAMVAETSEWRRTDKFRAHRDGLASLKATLGELVIGIAGIVLAAACLIVNRTGALLLLEAAVLLRAARVLVAPAAVLLADRELGDTVVAKPMVGAEPTFVAVVERSNS